jgi:uncharacterized membrane protein YgcG
MRALLAHPLLRLTTVVWLLAATSAAAAVQVPLPIGRLSDYGNVLDRHGRERLEARINDASTRLGIDVYLLASWENPYPSTRDFATAVFHTWGLDERRTLLTVFVRAGGRWSIEIVASRELRLAHPTIETDLAASLTDLVDHARIEEAMVTLFDRLDRSLLGAAVAPQTDAERPTLSPGLIVGLVVSLFVGLSLLAHRFMCPRCGRLLRRDRLSNRIYFCRHCHYRRGGP